MDNFRWVSKLSLVLAIAFEFGRVLGNITEGYSAFYLFDLSQRFSMDNNTFIIYWGAIIGIIFVSADALNTFENKEKNIKPTQEVIKRDRTDQEVDEVIENMENLSAKLNLLGILIAFIVFIFFAIEIYKEGEEGLIFSIIIPFILCFLAFGVWARFLLFLVKKRWLN